MRGGAAFIGFVVCGAVGFAVGYSAGRNAGEPRSASAPPKPPKAPAGDGAKIERVPIGESPVRGSELAPVTIVEFSELGCAFCARAAALMKVIETRFGDDVRFVWKTTGRSTDTAHALATEIALAANERGKFWELHARLATTSALDEVEVRAATEELALDADKLLASGRGKLLLEADRALAEKLGVTDTPLFFINGERVGALESASQLETMIAAARARAKEAGVAPQDVYAHLMSTASESAPSKRDTRPPPPADVRLDITPAKDAPRRGADGARVVIVVFSDFTSPFSARANPALTDVFETYVNDVAIELRHLPNAQKERAEPAAKAAIAAHQQGAFWKYHDLLFANPDALTDADFLKFAKQLALDLTRFERDRQLSAADAVLDRDRAEAAKLNVRGTPAYFINGLPMRGVQTYETLAAAIEAELLRPDPNAMPAKPKIDTASSPRRGKADAKVELVLWNDFECPACKKVPELVDRLLREHANDVVVVYKQYPLPTHPHAELASVAVLAAHRFGKFIEMHDRLFANQGALARADLVAHARAIGLDAVSFERALDDPALRSAVKADITEGVKLGVVGTPTVFIGAKRLEGLKTYDELLTAVRAALRSS